MYERKRNKEKTIDDRKKRSRQEKELEKNKQERKTNKKEQYEVYIMERQRSKSLCDERI